MLADVTSWLRRFALIARGAVPPDETSMSRRAGADIVSAPPSGALSAPQAGLHESPPVTSARLRLSFVRR
jgi:hypothetical protein